MPRPELSYIENRGQWDDEVLFFARTPGLDVWITRTGMVYDAFTVSPVGEGQKTKDVRRRGSVVRMEFAGASLAPIPLGQGQSGTRYSYFTQHGHVAETGLFSEALVKGMYDGVDIAFYFQNGVPRYDCIVQPGADYSKIALTIHGAQRAQIAEDGSLVLYTAAGSITQQGLVAYQMVEGRKQYIPCSFTLKNSSSTPVVGFSMGAYDSSLPVVIDPLVYAAFLGGSETDEMVDVVVDQGGNAYVVGTTMSADYPHSTGAYDMVWSGRDVVLTKLDYSGVGVLFSTFFGGSGDEYARGLARDKNGYLYVVGETHSTDLPATRTYSHIGLGGADIFVAKLNGSGTDIHYVTVVGGDGDDQPAAIAVDDTANVYVTGTTYSDPFPSYPVASEPNQGGSEAFLLSLNTNGVWRYSGTIGGSADDGGTAIAMDPGGTFFWVSGQTKSKNLPTTDMRQYQGTGNIHMFFARYRTSGEKLLLGYAGVGTAIATSIAVDARGDAYLAGYTPDGSFELPVPTIQPQYDKSLPVNSEGILLKIAPIGSSGKITYSTYLGSDDDDIIRDIAVDRNGTVVMVGSTTQQGIADSLFYDPKPEYSRSVRREGFIAALTPGERLLNYSTYFGGSGDDEFVAVVIARDSSLYVVGNTNSQDMPVSLGSPEYQGKQDGMIVKMDFIPKVQVADGRREIDFGTVYIGESKEESIVFLNAGTNLNTETNSAVVETMRFFRGQAFSSDLVVPAFIPRGIPAGELPVALTFRPASRGAFLDTVVFEVRYLKKTFEVVLRGVGAEKPPPVLVLKPDTLRIGKVFIGEHGQGTLTLRNEGAINAAVENIVLTGNAGFSYSGSTTMTVGVGGENALRIDFDPVVVGASSAVLRVYVERSTTPLIAVVQGEGVDKPQPDVYMETYETDFGAVQLGRSKRAVVVVSNTGQTSATLSIDTGDGPFTGTLDTEELKPSSSVGLNVVFAPIEAGSTEAQIRLHIAELTTTLVLTVKGEGVFPQAIVLPRDTVDFGSVRVNDTVSDKVFIRNTGIDTLHIATISIDGDGFTRRASTPANLGVGDSLEIDVDFAPTDQGSQSGSIAVVVDYLPELVPVALQGIGILDDIGPRGITVAPDTLDYGTVYISTISTATFVVSNRSTTQSIRISDIAIVQSGSEFVLATSRSFPYSIPAGSRDTIAINFSPITTGSVAAFARVVSTINTVAVELIGIGDDVPQPAIDTIQVVIPDIYAKIGEYTNVQLSFADPVSASTILQNAGVSSFSAVLRWNASVMLPVGGHATGDVKAGNRDVAIRGVFSNSTDSVFYSIPVRILWGDAEYAAISIVDLKLQPEESTSSIFINRSDTAHLHVTDIWHDRDGPRLVNPYANPLGLRVLPNPFDADAILTVEHASGLSSLVIYNLVGEAVLDLSSYLNGEEFIDIPLSVTMFPGGGIFYCRLVSGTHTVVRTLILHSQQP